MTDPLLLNLLDKILTSAKEAVETLLKDYILPYINMFDTDKWRKQNYWNEEVDRVFKFNINLINKLFDRCSAESRKRPGAKKFVSMEEYIQLCSDANLVEHFISERDPPLLYCMSMMTVVNELENERGSQMVLVEFLESLARIADKIEAKDIPDCKGLQSKLVFLLKTISKNVYQGSIDIIEPPPVVEQWEV